MRKNRYLMVLFLTLWSLWPGVRALRAGDTGRIVGTVIDGETGDPVAGANIYLQNTPLGAASDLDGHYSVLHVPPGRYTVIVTVVGYAEIRIKNVAVKAGQSTKTDVVLNPQILSTEVVEVEARALHNTEASLLKERQKAWAVSDAVSAEAMARAGAGNAAEAMKQVTGASIVDGKYVYVRGLGDRYTRTQLNGAALPAADPYKRSAAIDLIPADLVDNIVTVKSFTPDRPGDFSGGIVDIRTKDYPDRLQIKGGLTTAYNPQVQFNTHTIGMDLGDRNGLGLHTNAFDLPKILSDENVRIPDIGEANADPQKARLLTQMTRAFQPQMAPVAKRLPMNHSFDFSFGNQYRLFNRPLGVLASASYHRTYASYHNGLYRRWNQGSPQAMSNIYDYRDTDTKSTVMFGSLFKLSYGFSPYHKITFNALYNRDAQSEARYLQGIYTYDSDANRTHQTSVLSYKERILQSYQLNGEHVFKTWYGLRFDWRIGRSGNREDEPDRRVFSSYYTEGNGERVYGIKDNLPPKRYFRRLEEERNEGMFDVTVPFKFWRRPEGKLKFGAFGEVKQRQYGERLFTFSDPQGFRFDGNPNRLLDVRNTGIIGYDTVTIRGKQYVNADWGVVVTENKLPANNYRAEQRVSAAYAMLELPLTQRLRLVGGARLERTDMWLQTRDSTLERGTIRTADWLPSVNLIYNLRKNVNLRLALSRTLARPTFREIGPFATFDFDDGGDAYIGNPHLQRTLVNNADVRWEWFGRPGETYAVSLFYKAFENPIERVFNAFGENTWKNVEQATAYGMELELRQRLDRLHPLLRHFILAANGSLIRSRVSIAESELKLIRRLRPQAAGVRPFQGQSPYLMNFNLSYSNAAAGLSFSLYYNLFGERLDRVSYGGTPDVYEKATGLLNFSLAWRLVKHWTFTFSVRNLLNPAQTKYQRFNGREYIYSQYRRGRTVALGVRYAY